MITPSFSYHLLAFVFGAIIGSFLNVLIHRMPQGEDFVFRPSHCPYCQKKIRWFENVPILSFIMLRGRCSNCQKQISWRYPIVEILGGAMAIFLLPSAFSRYEILIFLAYFAVFSIFVVHFFIDLKHQILPDSLNGILAVIFLALTIFKHDWPFWLSGLLLGAGFPLLVTWLFYLLRGQVGLGGGDIKLFGALGIFLGPVGIIQNVFLSCALGSVVGITLILLKKMKKETPIPFGPFIIIVSFIQIFFPALLFSIFPP
ncbi:MAG TPA: prepilin peptidase [Bacteriovoracaceae bacterium]|nr:prepilin peptidase [Bacteriovoracaceae bacterium]